MKKNLISLKYFILGFFLKHTFYWNILNNVSLKAFKNSKYKIEMLEKNIIDTIIKDGIAITHIDDFEDCYNKDDLDKYYEEKKKIKISSIKKFFNYYVGGNYQTQKQKIKVNEFLFKISTSEPFLKIINTYFKLFGKLVYLELNETDLERKSSNSEFSQNWHRDPGIRKIIKVFIYFNDVDKNSGPFTYIKQSHNSGKWGKIFKQRKFGVNGCYPNPEEISNVIPNKYFLECTGKKGTIIFADTTGLHRGANQFKKKRVMSTSVFYPPADLKKSNIEIVDSKKNINDLQKDAYFSVFG